MVRQRIHKGFIVFDLDNNGDNYASFEKAVEIVRDLPTFNEQKYYLSFFDDALLWFSCEGIDIKLEYSGFMGTELKVDSNLDNKKLQKVLQLAEDIYEAIHNNGYSKRQNEAIS